MSVVSAAPKWFMKLISQAKNSHLQIVDICLPAVFKCLFCITNEKHTYIFGKSAVFSTRSDFFWRFILGVW